MSRKFILGLIKLYRSYPCLWKCKSKDYSNRDLKSAAYQRLWEYGKQYHSECTMHDIKQKIQNLRTTFRREYRKIQAAKLANEIRKPHLWYFRLLLFTLDVESNDNNKEPPLDNTIKISESPTPSETSYNDDDQDRLNEEEIDDYLESEQDNFDDLEENGPVFTAPISFQQPTNLKKRRATENLEEVYVSTNARIAKGIDEFEAAAISWTAKLRKLNDRQQVLAENLINQVLTRGYFDELTRETQLLH